MSPWLLLLAAVGVVTLVNGLLVALSRIDQRLWQDQPLAPTEKLGAGLAIVGGLMVVAAMYLNSVFALN